MTETEKIKEKIYTAESYEKATRIGKPFIKDGKVYQKISQPCERCGGHGVYACRVENGCIVPHPAYGGICLKCNGSGKEYKVIRLYSKAEIEKQKKDRETRRIEKEMNKLKRVSKERFDWLEKNNFNRNGDFYIILGNTYKIKESLKAKKCRFSSIFLWYSKNPIDVPDGYTLKKLNFHDFYDWRAADSSVPILKKGAKEAVKAILHPEREEKKESLSKYRGEKGDRLNLDNVILESSYTFDGLYGTTNIYTFKQGEDVFTWFTQKEIDDMEENEKFTLIGTVKKFSEYKGVKSTVLSRCIIKRYDKGVELE